MPDRVNSENGVNAENGVQTGESEVCRELVRTEV